MSSATIADLNTKSGLGDYSEVEDTVQWLVRLHS